MKYLKVSLLVGIEDSEWKSWDSSCDMTFGIAYLHQPEKHQYVLDHSDDFITDKRVDKLKYSLFTEEGGI